MLPRPRLPVSVLRRRRFTPFVNASWCLFRQARSRDGRRFIGVDPPSFPEEAQSYRPEEATPAHGPYGEATTAGVDVGVLAQAQRRALQTTCNGTSVVCAAGLVSGTTTNETCAAACGGACCVGDQACDGFTGTVCADDSCNGYQVQHNSISYLGTSNPDCLPFLHQP